MLLSRWLLRHVNIRVFLAALQDQAAKELGKRIILNVIGGGVKVENQPSRLNTAKSQKKKERVLPLGIAPRHGNRVRS